MYSINYNKKMHENLSDNNTYKQRSHKYNDKVNTLSVWLSRWKKKG